MTTLPHPELAAYLRLPLPLYAVLIRRAQFRGYHRTARALVEIAEMVKRTGVPAVRRAAS